VRAFWVARYSANSAFGQMGPVWPAYGASQALRLSESVMRRLCEVLDFRAGTLRNPRLRSMSSQPKRTSSADRRPANAPSARTGMSSGGAAKEQLLEALRTGKTSLLISPRHDEARKVAALVRQKLKAEGAIGPEDHAVT